MTSVLSVDSLRKRRTKTKSLKKRNHTNVIAKAYLILKNRSIKMTEDPKLERLIRESNVHRALKHKNRFRVFDPLTQRYEDEQ